MHHYIFEDGQVKQAELLDWARWFETADRIIDKTEIGSSGVSTVFLGIDHRMGEPGPPLIFETMVFGGKLDQETERYSTLIQAKAGHAEMCNRVRTADLTPSE